MTAYSLKLLGFLVCHHAECYKKRGLSTSPPPKLYQIFNSKKKHYIPPPPPQFWAASPVGTKAVADLEGGLGGQNPPSALEITTYYYTDSLARIARLIRLAMQGPPLPVPRIGRDEAKALQCKLHAA